MKEYGYTGSIKMRRAGYIFMYYGILAGLLYNLVVIPFYPYPDELTGINSILIRIFSLLFVIVFIGGPALFLLFQINKFPRIQVTEKGILLESVLLKFNWLLINWSEITEIREVTMPAELLFSLAYAIKFSQRSFFHEVIIGRLFVKSSGAYFILPIHIDGFGELLEIIASKTQLEIPD